jgi:hypothetical protein
LVAGPVRRRVWRGGRKYEGLVAKDEQSAYRSGPTRRWLKVKVRYEGVFIVGGILGSADACEGVLVGERVGRQLIYRGVRNGVWGEQQWPHYWSGAPWPRRRHSTIRRRHAG